MDEHPYVDKGVKGLGVREESEGGGWYTNSVTLIIVWIVKSEGNAELEGAHSWLLSSPSRRRAEYTIHIYLYLRAIPRCCNTSCWGYMGISLMRIRISRYKRSGHYYTLLKTFQLVYACTGARVHIGGREEVLPFSQSSRPIHARQHVA